MPQHIFRFLIRYKYELVFPVAILEGPIITMISGFLVSLGYLNFFWTLLLVFFADIISDSFFYSLGRHGRKFIEKISFLKISEARIQKLEEHYENHPGKTILVSKASYGVGALLLIAAGASKMAYQRFLEYIAPMNVVRSLGLLLIGYYFGKAYRHFFGTYLEYYIVGVVILLPFFYYAFTKREMIKEHFINAFFSIF